MPCAGKTAAIAMVTRAVSTKASTKVRNVASRPAQARARIATTVCGGDPRPRLGRTAGHIADFRARLRTNRPRHHRDRRGLSGAGHLGLNQLHAANYPDIVPATRDLHLPIFLGLRDGSYRLLMATGSEGIITFPSLHAALALILAAALWPLPVLRWIGLALNAMMMV